MKTLRKYLFICLISIFAFLIPTITKADTLKELEWKYTDDAYNFSSENTELLNNLYEYINDRTFYTTYSSYKLDTYAIIWDFHHIDDNYIIGRFIRPINQNISLGYQHSTSNKNNDMYTSNIYNKITISSSDVTIKFKFNTNNEITEYSSSSFFDIDGNVLNESYAFRYYESNALYNDLYIIYLDLYIDTHFLQNSDAYGYISVGDSFETYNLQLQIGKKKFNANDVVPIKTFFDYFATKERPADTDNKSDAITDSDIADADNTSKSFFNDFSTTDHGGISSVISAPLVAINKMLDSSCSPLKTTYKDKEIEFPCGTTFWDSLGVVKTFLNLIEGGLICYAVVTALYKDIERIKNPDDDRVDVMNL